MTRLLRKPSKTIPAMPAKNGSLRATVENFFGTEREMPHSSAESIAGDVLRYFLRNPEAADDLEGIARWRLLSETIHRSVQETSQVLEWLVRRGLLLKVETGSSEPVFRLNRTKRAEAEALLVEMSRLFERRPPEG